MTDFNQQRANNKTTLKLYNNEHWAMSYYTYYLGFNCVKYNQCYFFH